MKYLYLILFGFVFFSCAEEQDLGNLDQTIYVRNNGADMPVYLRGNMTSKVVVLILHGGPGSNGLEYRIGNWSVEMEEKYAMAYWDQRGQGMSQGHYKKADVTIDNMVEDMDAVVSVLKAKFGNDISVFALGHSWGGTLSAKYLTKGNLQHNLKGWIEVDGAHDMPKLNVEAAKMFKEVSNEQIALGNSIDYWQETLEWATAIDTNNISSSTEDEINQRGFEAEDVLLDDGVLQSLDEGGIQYSTFSGPVNPLTSFIIGAQTNDMLNDEISATALTDELPEITIPVLVLWGKYDFVVPSALGTDTYNLVQSANKKFVIFEKSGHSPMDNEWQKFTNEVILFVDANK